MLSWEIFTGVEEMMMMVMMVKVEVVEFLGVVSVFYFIFMYLCGAIIK